MNSRIEWTQGNIGYHDSFFSFFLFFFKTCYSTWLRDSTSLLQCLSKKKKKKLVYFNIKKKKKGDSTSLKPTSLFFQESIQIHLIPDYWCHVEAQKQKSTRLVSRRPQFRTQPKMVELRPKIFMACKRTTPSGKRTNPVVYIFSTYMIVCQSTSDQYRLEFRGNCFPLATSVGRRI